MSRKERSMFYMPKVLSQKELLDKAFRRARKVSIEIDKRKRIESIRLREMQRIDIVKSVLVDYLLKVVEESPNIRNMNKFYANLINSLIDVEAYRKSMAALKWAAEIIERLEEKYRKKIKGTGFYNLAPVRREFYGRVSSIIKQISKNLDFLEECRYAFKNIPVIRDMDTFIVAGMPNVGKSTFLKNITDADVDIQPYPFTTKGIQVGILEDIVQFVDTPGILDRELGALNRIEYEAFVSLKYLSDKLIYIIDPSLSSGYKLDEQLRVFKNILRELEFSKLYVVVNKTDLVSEEDINKVKENVKDNFKGFDIKFFETNKDDKESIEDIKKFFKTEVLKKMKSYRRN